MIKKIYVYDPFTNLHKFLIKNIIYELENKFIVKEINKIENLDGIIIIFINHHFIKNELINDDYNKLKENKYNILYITEPLDFIIEQNYYKKIIKDINPFLLLTYSYGNFNKLRVYQKMIKFYPINKIYFSFINNISHNKIKDKIVFIGKMNENRQYIKDIFKDKLVIIGDVWSKEEWIKIMNKYLFFINIHRRKVSDCLETLRIYPLLYNGAVIFSELVNKREMEIYNEYNIHFYERNNLLEAFNNYNINYNTINEKMNRFRSRENNNINELCNIINTL